MPEITKLSFHVKHCILCPFLARPCFRNTRPPDFMCSSRWARSMKWIAEHFLAEKAEKFRTPSHICRAPFLVNECAQQPLTAPDLVFQIAALTGTAPEASDCLPMHGLRAASRCIVLHVLKHLRHEHPGLPTPGVGVCHLTDT